MNTLQNQINNATGIFKLKPGEYEGPVKINHPVTLKGNNSTIWSKLGPVIEIDSDLIELKNLCIEVTGNPSDLDQQIAIKSTSQYSLQIEHVEVRGRVIGFGNESGDWRYPPFINLGHIPCGRIIESSMQITVPVPCKLVSQISGITFSPQELNPGPTKIQVNIGPLLKESIICGSILLVSQFIRRIPVNGIVVESQNYSADNQLLFDARTQSKQQHIQPIILRSLDSNVTLLKKGQRIDLLKEYPHLTSLVLGVEWESSTPGVEVDVSIFMLGKDDKVLADTDFIFYGNKQSSDNNVMLLGPENETKERIAINLEKIDGKYAKVLICLSLYEGKLRKQNFSKLANISLKVSDQTNEEKLYYYNLTNEYTLETVLILGAIYRYKESWKFAAVGLGYNEELNYLCKKYGVDVE